MGYSSTMGFTITSKVALITGGCGGLGCFLAKELLQQGLKGVSLIDTNNESGLKIQRELRKEFGQNSCIFIKTDVSQPSQLEDAFNVTVSTFKQLDIVINNAAIISEINWKKCLEVNLGGCILGTKLAIDTYLPKYKSGPEALIINVSSIMGLEPLGLAPVYTATKHGIVAISRSYGLKEHYNRTNVKVITVCPGHMTTSLIMNLDLTSFHLDYMNYFNINFADFPIQSPEFVAKSVSDIIKDAENGSVWMIEDSQPPNEIIFPEDRFSMCKSKL